MPIALTISWIIKILIWIIIAWLVAVAAVSLFFVILESLRGFRKEIGQFQHNNSPAPKDSDGNKPTPQHSNRPQHHEQIFYDD